MTNRAFAAAVTLAFLVPAIYGALHHEMWRDELQAWLIARDTTSIADLVRVDRYAGHPFLWHLALVPVTRAVRSPVAMQALHVAVAAATVFLVARHAPFSRVQRALFAFGYFPLYEYCAIARCYAPSLLFVVLACVHDRKKDERPIAYGALLFFLAQTNVVAMIVASALTLAWLVESRARTTRTAVGVVIAALGAVACILQVWPPADSTLEPRVLTDSDLPAWHFVAIAASALVAIPRPEFFFWNSSAIESALGPACAALAVLLVAWIAFSFGRARAALVVFAASAIALPSFFGFLYPGDTRHHGFVFVAFLAAAWIGWPNARATLSPTLTALLVCHVAGATIALAHDGRYVFSSGERAAAWLRANGLADAPIVAEPEYAAATVTGYLGTRGVLTPRLDGPRSYFFFSKGRGRWPDDDALLDYAARVREERGRPIVVMTNYALAAESLRAHRVEPLVELTDSMEQAENFFLYRAR